MSPAAGHDLRLAVMLLVLTAAVTVATGAGAASETETDDAEQAVGDRMGGEQLFLRDCATCHGPRGAGTGNGPAITDEGTASIDFQMRTRRMPIPDPSTEVKRGIARRADGSPVVYSERERADIVAYAEEWTTGPAVPDVPTVSEVRALAAGGELYRQECAVCHQLAGQGGVLLNNTPIPSVLEIDRVGLVEAVRAGPYSMPAFAPESISEQEAAQIATYVVDELQATDDPGGWGAGHLGPFGEGAAVWVFGVLTLLLAAGWVGRRT